MIPIYPTTNYLPPWHILQTTRSPMDLHSNTSFPSPFPFHILIWGCGPTLLPKESWTPWVPHPSHPCHPHTPPPPWHHHCFLSPSLLCTLPHPHCFMCAPLLQTLAPPCKVSLQPINELVGLVLKWEALL